MISKVVAMCVMAFLLPFQVVIAQENDSVIGSVEKLLEVNRNIEGEFRQVTYDEKGKELQISEGVFLLAKPNQFVWDSITPFAQRIVSDGKTITVWDVDLEQATQKNVSGSVSNSPAALLGQPASEVLPNYEIDLMDKDQFRLAPKKGQDLFQTLTLSFKNEMIHTMSILDALGQTTVIEFNNVERHDGVARENFSLVLPDYVDVIVEGR